MGGRWNFDDAFHSFGDITTFGWLAAVSRWILDIEVASAMIAGDLDISYTVINPSYILRNRIRGITLYVLYKFTTYLLTYLLTYLRLFGTFLAILRSAHKIIFHNSGRNSDK